MHAFAPVDSRAPLAILYNSRITIGKHVQLGMDCAVATVAIAATKAMIEERISTLVNE